MRVTALMRMKSLLKPVHRWFGLLILLFVLLSAATGFVIQWDEELVKRVAEREIWARPADSRARDGLVPAAQAAIISAPAPVTRLMIGAGDADLRPQAYAELRAPSGDAAWIAAIDADHPARSVWMPAGSGAMRGFTDTLYLLHDSLLLGLAGTLVMTAVAAILVLLAPSGLVLWWPLARFDRRQFRTTPGLRGRNRHYDRHRIIGLYTAPLIFLVASSGLLIGINRLTLAEEEAAPAAPLSFAIDTARAAERLALARFPAANYIAYTPPSSDNPVHVFQLRQPGEPYRSYGRTSVTVSADGGRIVAVTDALAEPAGTRFDHMLLALHNGEYAGMAGKIVYAAGALAIVWLGWAGAMHWWLRTRGRRRAGTRRDKIA